MILLFRNGMSGLRRAMSGLVGLGGREVLLRRLRDVRVGRGRRMSTNLRGGSCFDLGILLIEEGE
jgi:hypothetical protein